MRRSRIVALAGFIFSLLSLVLPVGEIRGILGLSYTLYGFTTDVAISFIVLLIALGILMTKYKGWKPMAVFILAFIALIIVGVTINNVNVAIAETGEGNVAVFSYGPGIFFAIISPITFMIGALLMRKEKPIQTT